MIDDDKLAPDAGPKEGVAFSDPRHPRFHRRPATSEESLRWAAAGWTPDRAHEIDLVLLAEYPDLAGQVRAEVQAGRKRYQEVRDAAREAGRTIAPLSAADHEQIAQAAELARLDPVDFRAVESTGRAELRRHVTTDHFDPNGAHLAWLGWTRSYLAAVRQASRRGFARDLLGLRGGGGVINVQPPVFDREVAEAREAIRRSIEQENQEQSIEQEG